MSKLTTLLSPFPGLLLISVIVASASYASFYTALGAVVLAIFFGFVVGNLFKISATFQLGVTFAEKKLLALAIVLLGFQLDISVFRALGLQVLAFIVIIVLASLFIGYVTARIFRLSPTFSLLLAVGNAICGTAAIAAVLPLVKPKQFETGLSISVVNLLGSLGIFLVPLTANYVLEMNAFTNGIMIGSTLQSMGQVVAAGFSFGSETGEVALLVKMGRILMLCPTLLCLSLFFYVKSGKSQAERQCPIPCFIVLFLIAVGVNNIFHLPAEWLQTGKTTAKYSLIAAMAAFGLKINLSTVVQQGAKSLCVGSVVFTFQILFALAFISLFFNAGTFDFFSWSTDFLQHFDIPRAWEF